MIILDTDVVIWVLRGNTSLVSALHRTVIKETTGISTLTTAELYQNIFPSEIPAVEDFINHQEIFVVSTEIAKLAGLYWNEYHRDLKKLSLVDCLIAATAKVHQAKLATLNVKHFPMPDIELINLSLYRQN